MIKKLSSIDIELKIIELNVGIKHQWTIKNARLNKTFVFEDFVKAFDFIGKVAVIAENTNHHPEWSNIYNKVEIDLISHDVKGLSERDFELAALIDKL